MVKRIVKLSKSHSFLLFGARGTGKTTLLNEYFLNQKYLFLDLLDNELNDRLSQNPKALLQLMAAKPDIEWVIIDEIQKIPLLLDVIHQQLKNKKIKFALTGSSARKLKRDGANLLAGRAFNYKCHPLTAIELSEKFNLDQVLSFGSLPEVFDLEIEDKKDFLRSYVDTYFKEEIVAEQVVRKLKPFRNFLEVSAQMNGKILNLNKISNDVGVDHSTVQSYFEILEDTLVGFLLNPYHDSIRKRQRTQSKFYYFDTGVTRALQKKIDQPLHPSTFEYGDLFEQFIILEIKRLIDYYKPDWSISYLRTKDDAEIDLIIERPSLKKVAIEIKSTDNLSKSENKPKVSFAKLAHDLGAEAYVFSNDSLEIKIDKVWCLPWQAGFRAIGLI